MLSLQNFLSIYPIQSEFKSQGNTIHWFWKFDLKSSAQDIWPFISDTSRFNRFIGINKMDFWEENGILKGKSTNLGIPMEWVEVPWVWTYAKMLQSARVYSKGFSKVVRVTYHFDTAEKILYVHYLWVPRNFLSRLLLIVSEGVMKSKYANAIDKMDEQILRNKKMENPFKMQPEPFSPDVLDRLSKIETKLIESGLSETTVRVLIEHIKTSDDMELQRIRVLELAHKYNIDYKELLVVCLNATRTGLLTLSWDVICPHCRGVREEMHTLGDVPKKSACEVCEIDFENSGENSIEITFHVHPSIKKVQKIFYCSAEPALKKHIRLQQYLNPGQEVTAGMLEETGKFRLRVKGESGGRDLELNHENDTKIVLWDTSSIWDKEFASPGSTLKIQNNSENPLTFLVESVDWDNFALKPGHLFNLQDFHDIFAQESLGSDIQLEIGTQTILFTDIVGSTMYYAEVGDAKAFSEVKRHFEEIYGIVKQNQGAVIKTIGDAAMVSFSNPQDAFKAALELQKLFVGKRSELKVKLRISIHTGTCLAVNLNSNIDYFGNTVNVASKLQKAANADQIVISDTFYSSPGVAEYIKEKSLPSEILRMKVAGHENGIKIIRYSITS